MAKNYPKLNMIGLRELRENMEKYVRQVEKGKRFLILRKSKPVFKIEPVDEWGDEGHWTDYDLRDENGEGIPMENFLKILKKSIAEDAENRKIHKEVKRKR